jgi:hypothetical protein
LFAEQAHADEGESLNRNNSGTIGLVDMPSARMAADGNLSISLVGFNRTQRYNFGAQITPWLEASFRYTGLQHFEPRYPTYYDRAFAIKVRLWNESDYLPSVAVGISDLVGTGVYSGEYVVASKQIGAVDVTLGMGWGRLASANTIPNPLGVISSFKNRTITTVGQQGQAGSTNFGNFFHGKNVGIFGGAVWHTPLEGLDLVAEISSDTYDQEVAAGNFRPQNRFNFSASYAVTSGVRVGAESLYGSGFGLTLSFDLDPTKSKYAAKFEPEMTPVSIREDAERREAILNMMRDNGVSAEAQAARRATMLSMRRNAVVDKLFVAIPDLQDANLQGRTLVVTVARGNLFVQCQAAALTLQGGDVGLDSVTVRSTAGGQTARCAPPLTAASYRAEAAPTIGVPLMLAASSPMLIDATRVMNTPANRGAAARRIRAAATAQRLYVYVVTLQDSQAVIYYTNNNYFSEAEAASRLFRILMKEAPPEIERFRVIAMVGDVPQREFDALRSPMERAYSNFANYSALDEGISMQPASPSDPVLKAGTRGSYPRFSWNFSPQVRQSLFDPYKPVAFQLVGRASANLELFPGFSVSGEAETMLFDKLPNRVNDSVLPHVRTDFEQYMIKGRTGIGNLEVDYRFKPMRDVTGIVRAGYLESMFGGVGGQLLWRPEGQRWALGVDLYEVWQRKFDRLFGFQNYHVMTGHASLYYQSPWYDLDFAAHVGRYLAGDTGATFQVTRRFTTGVEVGAFATFTNVSAARFGEGSFDKGIIIRIPLGWITPVTSQVELVEEIRPVQRDGGQRLAADDLLFEETRRTSYGEIQRHLSDLVRP